MPEEIRKNSKYGRKKLSDHLLLSERIVVRFNKSDFELITHLAKSAGKNTGPFIRELATKKVSDIKIESKTDAINTNQLKKVGVNLNQISKNLNTYKYDRLPEFIVQDLESSLSDLKAIVQSLK